MTIALLDPHAIAMAARVCVTPPLAHVLGAIANGGLDVPVHGYLDCEEAHALVGLGLLSSTNTTDMFGEMMRYEATEAGRCLLAMVGATSEPMPTAKSVASDLADRFLGNGQFVLGQRRKADR